MEYFNRVMLIFVLLIVLLMGYGVFRINEFIPLDRNVVLIPGSEKDTPLQPLLPGAKDDTFLLSELNQYRTNKGVIKIQHPYIFASLYNREWSVKYSIPKSKHEVGIYAGTFWGAYYRYNFFRNFTIGAAASVQDSTARFAISAGYQF